MVLWSPRATGKARRDGTHSDDPPSMKTNLFLAPSASQRAPDRTVPSPNSDSSAHGAAECRGHLLLYS